MSKIKFHITIEQELENDRVEEKIEKKELPLYPHFQKLSKLAKFLTIDDMVFYRLI